MKIVLSEKDFDYEIQALINSFFPGQKSQVIVGEKGEWDKEELLFFIHFGNTRIQVSMSVNGVSKEKEALVLGEGDWHKHTDKTAHPYRTYYKNELKRAIFELIKEFPTKALPEGVKKSIPVWGTMTGVRPTKIPMNQLLQGKTDEEVGEELRKCYCCTEEKWEICMGIAKREAELLKQVDFYGGYSLYIGIPFCPTTCLYCSFTSYPFQTFSHLVPSYLKALKKEIAAVSKACAHRKLTSIYIGGGTPTTLNAEQLEELLSFVRTCFPMEDSYEFTVEAGRPDSITRDKLEVLRKYHVERISVNPQTMQQKTLDLIGRKHTVEETKEAFLMARELGFSNINMDLIIGLPGETVEDFEDTLQQVEALHPDSITVHSLVIKRASALRTVLEESEGVVFDEEHRGQQMEKMLSLSQEFAKAHGYKPYYMYRQKNSAGHYGSSGQENIGFSKPGKECLYNILIMEEMQTIAAVGAGASTKIYHPDKKIVSRIENVKSITDYIDRIDEMIERKKGAFEQ